MQHSFFHKLASVLWGGIVILIVMLAIYVGAGRIIVANVGNFRVEILQGINARVPFLVEAQQMSGHWQSFTPIIVLTGLRLTFPQSLDLPFELSEGRIHVDILNSLRTRSLQMSHVTLTDLSLSGELSADGRLHLNGFGSDQGATVAQLQAFLLNAELVTLKNNRLMLTMPSGEIRDMSLNLLLSRQGSARRVEAKLSSTSGTHISVLAEGVGDPLRPDFFTGQAYLDIQVSDLGAVNDLVADRQPVVSADGAVNAEFWLDWNMGHSSVEARLEGRDLLITHTESLRQVPVDRVAFKAKLLQRENRWTLFISDLESETGDVALALPRLQLDVLDGALRIRAADIPLEPLSAIFVDTEPLSEKLRAVVSELQPRGQVSLLQVGFSDVNQLARDWEVEANFEEVTVNAVKGAPGITAATGYINLMPGNGFVVLDSQLLTLDFPPIYHAPLHFYDLYGTLHLNWDADNVTLSSGLLTTQGEEGTVKALLGLNIPRRPSDSGIEMDLLVGLQNLHPAHRVKYMPYVLKPSLLSWLNEAIGDGVIEQGAFLWRGSFRKNAAALHTTQLAFNVANIEINYHPQWPPLLVEKGLVLIDDSEVSVWAERADLFDSTVEQLSVETRLNARGEITLAVNGRLLGPAADALRALNDSPLQKTVGSAFAAWTATGEVETDVALHLNLSDLSVAPWVDVTTRWRDVNLLIMPGNLPVKSVNGDFSYSTFNGFSSSALAGELWGETVIVTLEQRHRDKSRRYDPATSALNVGLATSVSMSDVHRWLQLEPSGFVTGQASVDIGIALVGGQPPVLTVDSDLKGVGLDLPQPWKKRKEEPSSLHLEMPMAGASRLLSLNLGDELKFKLDIVNGRVRGGGLGINAAPPDVREDVLRVVGHTVLLQGDEWLGFIRKYFSASKPVLSKRDERPGGLTEVLSKKRSARDTYYPEPALLGPPLAILIDALKTDTLVIMDQPLRDATLSLALNGDQWRVSLLTDWLSGEISQAEKGEPVRLGIDRLELDRLSNFKLFGGSDGDGGGGGGDSKLGSELSAVQVVVNNLFMSGERLGELAFELDGQDGIFTAKDITGELATFQLRGDRPSRLVWHSGLDGYTELQADLNFENLGRALEYFGYQQIVETDSGNFELELRWPGAPQSFSLREGHGSMQVMVGSGSFLEVPAGAAETVRVVSILDLADIVRRLSLTHMFESGIPFDSVDGEIYLHQGTLEVARMDVDGSSSFQFKGVSDVESQALSGELIATLPVVSNLSWIAALAAASLPVAAGVFVVSKVFNAQMDRLSTAVYRISGSWTDPQVSFDHIFDTSQASAAAASESVMKFGEIGGKDDDSEPDDIQPPAPSGSP